MVTAIIIAVSLAVGFGGGRIGRTKRADIETTLAGLEAKGVSDVKAVFTAIRAKL